MVICAPCTPCTDCLSLLCLSYTLSTVIFFSSLLINVLCAGADLSFLPAFFFYGDIELNPGPTNFTVCTVNIRSILRPLHSAAASTVVGGDTGFLIREPFTQLSTSMPQFFSSELYSVTLKMPRSKISFFNICRLSSLSSFSIPFYLFWMKLTPFSLSLPPHLIKL